MRRHAKAIVAISALLLTLALGVTFASATAPVVSIEAPSSVSYTSVHLAGKVNPEDAETYFFFQYSANPEAEGWAQGTFQGPLASGAGETAVSEDLSGLKPGTQYFVRLVAFNSLGEESASAEPHPSFTTDAVALPSVSIAAPGAITGESAQFSGQIDPGAPAGNPAAFDVNWHFECTPACPGLGGGTIAADSASHEVSATATGLEPGTAYEVSLVASNAGGQASAGPESFSALTIAPGIKGVSAKPLSTEAMLTAQVNPGGLQTSYHFEYGPTASYGHSTPAETIPAGGVPVTVKASLSGLSPLSGYHYRLVAASSAGTSQGADQTFSTVALPAAGGTVPTPSSAPGCPPGCRTAAPTSWSRRWRRPGSTRGAVAARVAMPSPGPMATAYSSEAPAPAATPTRGTRCSSPGPGAPMGGSPNLPCHDRIRSILISTPSVHSSPPTSRTLASSPAD